MTEPVPKTTVKHLRTDAGFLGCGPGFRVSAATASCAD